jgi:hypothetical protein
MSWQNGSDIGIQILSVARDGIRLELVRLPYAVVDENEFTLVPVVATDQSRRRWLQVASPPPPRVDGRPWNEAYNQASKSQIGSSTGAYAGPLKLGRPPLESLVLDQQVELESERGRTIEFVREEPGNPLGFAANEYPLPEGPIDANAYIQCQLAWKHTLQVGAWIAISFDRFDPNAPSAAFLAEVANKWLFEDPSETGSPKAVSAS